MTEAELLELMAIYSSNGITAFTVYISFTFAYLTTAYFAGRQLSTAQSIVVSVLYVFSALSALMSNIAQISGMQSIRVELEHSEVYQRMFLFDGKLWLLYMPFLLVGGILGALYFMYDIRKRADV